MAVVNYYKNNEDLYFRWNALERIKQIFSLKAYKTFLRKKLKAYKVTINGYRLGMRVIDASLEKRKQLKNRNFKER